jgi:hypothetical protein
LSAYAQLQHTHCHQLTGMASSQPDHYHENVSLRLLGKRSEKFQLRLIR